MSDSERNPAVAFREANPVPNPDDLQLVQVRNLSTRDFTDVAVTGNSSRWSELEWDPPRFRLGIISAALVVVLVGLAVFLATRADESGTATQVPSTIENSVATDWDDLSPWASGGSGPGVFRSLHFEPALRFTLTPGWVASAEGANTKAFVRPIEWPTAVGSSAIYIYSHGYLDNTVRSNPPTAQELVDWIAANESSFNVEQSTYEIGGITATKLDFDLSQNMLYIRTRGMDGPNVIHDFDQENEVAIYVLDVNGHTVSIVVEAEPPTDLATLEQRAQPVLDSIIWRNLEN